MATKADKLNPKQEAALELLAAGKNVTETAEAIGVARQTVSDWLNNQAAFIAAYNARRQELWGAASERLRAMVPKALEVLEGDLTAGNTAAAIAVLKAAGLHGLTAPTGPTTTADVEAQRTWDLF